MSFDENPADDYEHYQCSCGGSITRGEKSSGAMFKGFDVWTCDTCDLVRWDDRGYHRTSFFSHMTRSKDGD